MLYTAVNDAAEGIPYAVSAMDTQGKRIRHLRDAKGWSLEQLAKLVGTTKGAIAQWESDQVTNIRPENLLLLCENLGTDPWYIVFGPERRPPSNVPTKTRRRAA